MDSKQMKQYLRENAKDCIRRRVNHKVYIEVDDVVSMINIMAVINNVKPCGLCRFADIDPEEKPCVKCGDNARKFKKKRKKDLRRPELACQRGW